MDLLLEYGGGSEDIAGQGKRAAKIAERLEGANEWHMAQGYWERAVSFAREVGDEVERRRFSHSLANAHVQEAQQVAERPHVGKLMAASAIQKAIAVLRTLGGERGRVDELHGILIAYQRDVPQLLRPISTGVDLSDIAEAARAAVSGKTTNSALLIFAFHVALPDTVVVRKQVEDNATRYVFKSLFPSVHMSREGKVIARPGSTSSHDPNEREAAIRVDMIQHLAMHGQISAAGSIVHARWVIITEHALRVSDMLAIVRNNPLVPEAREMLWAEGLYAGFIGDMPKALSILIPQIEHSFRVVLAAEGVLVSGLDQDGIQMERNLNSLLYEPKLIEMFGADLIFALQAMLVEQTGPNLRNGMAHGLLQQGDFFGGSATYAWWLAFRLCCEPMVRALTLRYGGADTDTTAEGSGGDAGEQQKS